METKTKGDIAKEYLKKYPNRPIMTIARMIYSKHNLLFKDLESCRTVLRYHAGLSGESSRKTSKETTREKTYVFNPFDKIPESYKSSAEFFYLPTSLKKLLILNDIHFPYHDPVALKTAIDRAVEEKVDSILLNGDILDFYGLSSFDKNPSKPKMKVELEQGRWFMEALRTTFPGIPIYYKIGNHENRLERWLKVKAPEWIDCDEFQIDTLLQFGKYGIQKIDSNTVIRKGNLSIIHGHEYKGGGTIYPARGLYMKTKSDTICGHFHRSSSFETRDINEQMHGCWVVGCLCELNPEYMPKGNDWKHGYAIVNFNGDSFVVNNYTI